MPKFEVKIPLVGTAVLEIAAKDEDKAVYEGFRQLNQMGLINALKNGTLDNWEWVQSVTDGYISEVEIEEIEEDEEEEEEEDQDE